MLRSFIGALFLVSGLLAPEVHVQRPCTPAEALRTTPDTSGYCSGGWWVMGLIDQATYQRVPPTHTIGRALHYAPGVMEQVVANKGYVIPDNVVGVVSLLPPSVVGWTINIKVPTREGWLLVFNADAAALHHMYPHAVFPRSPIEFSYPLALETGLIDWIDPVTGDRFFDVEICLSLQPEVDCAGEPVNYKRWFLSVVRFQ